MASRRFRRDLEHELPGWQERGWVTAEAAAAMRSHYGPTGVARAWGAVIRAVFGTVLTLGGLILVLAHNWEELSRPLRAGLSVLPLLVCFGLGFWRMARGPLGFAWRESLALGASLAYALAVSLVAQTYQISGDLPSFLGYWCLVMLLLSLLLTSAGGWLLLWVLGLFWGGSLDSMGSVVAVCLGCLLAAGFGCHRLATERPRLTLALGVIHLLSGWIWVVLVAEASHRVLDYGECFVLWSGGVYLLGKLRSHWVPAWVTLLAAAATAVAWLVVSFEDAWRTDYLHGISSTAVSTEWAYLPLACAFALLLVVGLARRQFTPLLLLWANLAPLFILAKRLIHEPWLGMVLANALLLGLALWTLVEGLKRLRALHLNLGWLLLSALILCRFFDQDLGYLVRGVAFIGLGLGFFAVNGLLQWRRKQA